MQLPLDNPNEVTSTITDRTKLYGSFDTLAVLSTTLRNVWQQHYYQLHPNEQVPAFVLEGITMIFHKLARAANGNILYVDNFTDVAGFAKLIVDNLKQYPGATDSTVITAPTITAE
jgi:hypothetical protein